MPVQIILTIAAIAFTVAMIIWLRGVNKQQTELDAARVDAAKTRYEFYKNQNQRESSSSPVPTIGLNTPATLNDRIITIAGIQPYSHSMMKSVYGESSGFALDIVVENKGSQPIRLSPLQFTVQDSDGRPFSYYDVHPGGKRPSIEPLTDVAPGQKLRGYISYAGTGKPVVIYYNSRDGNILKFVP